MIDTTILRWQVFTAYHWTEGHLYGEYEYRSAAESAMEALRSKGLYPMLHEQWLAHYSHFTNK
jgi:macrodomain Ter protein organizer (MatP/YcbG family)